jgi:4-amino-4-deoxy-L-arabinose transferase-like glycosyltransferase
MNRRPTRRDWMVAILLGLVATGILGVAGRSEGFTRDEGYYFDAAEMYQQWYGDLPDTLGARNKMNALRTSVDRWFGYNHEHPALMKTLYGISWRLLHKCHCPEFAGRHPGGIAKRHHSLGLLGDAAALRFPADLAGGLLVTIAYLFGLQIRSRRAGLVGAALSLAAPRLFFHAELACFDAPMATTWLLAIYCYYRALSERKWAWRTGVAVGLAVATKHNGLFLPFVMGAHWLWILVVAWRQKRGFPSLRPFFWMAILAPAIEFLHWPWLWFDTVNRFREYLGFHLNHVYYNFEFLGTNYNKPPFPKSFAFVMTGLTAPVTTLALAFLAFALFAIAANRRRKSGEAGDPTAPGLLIGLNAFFPLGIIAFTGAPIFGATKHWLPAIPFLGIAAGIGLDHLTQIVIDHFRLDGRRAQLAVAGAVVLAIAPAAAETFRSHPYALTHYNLLAGGPPGGADLGLNRQFWGYATRGILPWLNEHAPRNANIYWHDTNQAQLNMNVREKLQRDDLLNTGLEEPGVKSSTIAMVIHEKHFNKYEYWIWDFYGTTRPSLVLTDEGVPMVTLYERPLK